MVEFPSACRTVGDETAIGVHRPAVINRAITDRLHLRQHFVELEIERPVDHDAHRALCVVRADVGHRVHEIRIGQGCLAMRNCLVR